MWVAIGHGYIGSKDLPANWVRDRNWDPSDEGRVGCEAVGKTACGALRSHAIVLVLHVRIGWPDEEGQIQEVPTALRGATNSLLGSLKKRQAEGGRSGVPRDDEPD